MVMLKLLGVRLLGLKLMMRSQRLVTVSAVIVLGVAMTETALAKSFMGLGDLPGGDFFSQANAVSGDGSVVVGFSRSASNEYEAFRWTEADGIVGLGDLPGGNFSSIANAVSYDGSVIVGAGTSGSRFSRDEPFRWTQADGMVGLGAHIPNANIVKNAAYGVSGDGSIVIGSMTSSSREAAFRWTETEGITELSNVIEKTAATGISRDGSIIVGSIITNDGNVSTYEAIRWTEEDEITRLGDLPGGISLSAAQEVSDDGSVIVGVGHSPSGMEAFRWTETDGMIGLGDLPGGHFTSNAQGVSGDGSIVLGSGLGPSGPTAFIWDENNGLRNLQTILVDDFGMDLTGWHLTGASDVSADGMIIVGVGINPEGFEEGWIADLCCVSEIVAEPFSIFKSIAMVGGSCLAIGAFVAPGVLMWKMQRN